MMDYESKMLELAIRNVRDATVQLALHELGNHYAYPVTGTVEAMMFRRTPDRDIPTRIHTCRYDIYSNVVVMARRVLRGSNYLAYPETRCVSVIAGVKRWRGVFEDAGLLSADYRGYPVGVWLNEWLAKLRIMEVLAPQNLKAGLVN